MYIYRFYGFGSGIIILLTRATYQTPAPNFVQSYKEQDNEILFQILRLIIKTNMVNMDV